MLAGRYCSVRRSGRGQRPASRVCLLAALVLGGCGDSPPTEPDTPDFAGSYATRVTLRENSCGPVTVQDNPTTVTYQEATRAVTFNHVGITYSGVVAADSSFSTTPRSVNVGDGYSYTIALTGRFGSRSFEADATVDRTGLGAACRYLVHWSATR